MGFFKKVFKGVKKVFKKVGRAVKKGFKKFGKFMNKIGIVGQIAMMFVLPHVGAMLLKSMGATTWGSAFSAMATSGGNAIVRGAGHVLKAAHGVATSAGRIYKTVTQGLMDFGKTALNKIPFVNIEGAAANFVTGPDSVLSRVKVNANSILDPWKTTITGNGRTLGDISSSTGRSLEELGAANENLVKGVDPKEWGNIVTGENSLITTEAPKVSAVSVDPSKASAVSVQPTTAQGAYDQMIADAEAKGRIPKQTSSILEPPRTAVEAYNQSITRAEVEGRIPKQSVTADAVGKADIKLVSELDTGSGWGKLGEIGGKGIEQLRARYNLTENPLSAVSNISSDISRFSSAGELDDGGLRTDYGGYVVNMPTFSRQELEANPVAFNNNFINLQNQGHFGYPSNVHQERNVWQNWAQRIA